MSGGMQGGGGVAEDLLTTKGDTHGYTTENARVPIGTDGQVITADSTVPLGLGWATAGGVTQADVDESIVNNVVDRWINRGWISRVNPVNEQWNGVEYSPELGIFVTVANTGGTNRAMSSYDGITWTGRTTPSSAYTDVVWSPELSLFCATGYSGSNRVMTSPDGITWTGRTASTANSWVSIAYAPSLVLFCCVSQDGSGNRVMTSPDGTNWTTRTSAADNSWRGVTWSADLSLFCAVARNGTGNRVMTSPDGITWTIRTSAADNNWEGVSWSPELSLFCAVSDTGTGNRVMTSPNGITWTTRTSAADNSWKDVTWSEDLLLFCAVSSAGTNDRVMTSPDGINWTSRINASTGGIWMSVIWGRGMFVAVSEQDNGDGHRLMSTVL